MAMVDYFELHVDWHDDGNFAVEFGDVDREVVEDERRDMRASYEDLRKHQFKIVRTKIAESDLWDGGAMAG